MEDLRLQEVLLVMWQSCVICCVFPMGNQLTFVTQVVVMAMCLFGTTIHYRKQLKLTKDLCLPCILWIRFVFLNTIVVKYIYARKMNLLITIFALSLLLCLSIEKVVWMSILSQKFYFFSNAAIAVYPQCNCISDLVLMYYKLYIVLLLFIFVYY